MFGPIQTSFWNPGSSDESETHPNPNNFQDIIWGSYNSTYPYGDSGWTQRNVSFSKNNLYMAVGSNVYKLTNGNYVYCRADMAEMDITNLYFPPLVNHMALVSRISDPLTFVTALNSNTYGSTLSSHHSNLATIWTYTGNGNTDTWSPLTVNLTDLNGSNANCYGVEISNDGLTIAFGIQNRIYPWDYYTNQAGVRIYQFQGGQWTNTGIVGFQYGYISDIALSGDGLTLVILYGGGTSIKIFRFTNGNWVTYGGFMNLGGSLDFRNSVEITKDGKIIAISGGNAFGVPGKVILAADNGTTFVTKTIIQNQLSQYPTLPPGHSDNYDFWQGLLDSSGGVNWNSNIFRGSNVYASQSNDGYCFDDFGYSISLSQDGDYLALSWPSYITDQELINISSITTLTSTTFRVNLITPRISAFQIGQVVGIVSGNNSGSPLRVAYGTVSAFTSQSSFTITMPPFPNQFGGFGSIVITAIFGTFNSGFVAGLDDPVDVNSQNVTTYNLFDTSGNIDTKDFIIFPNPNPNANRFFWGESLSVSADGSTLAVLAQPITGVTTNVPNVQVVPTSSAQPMVRVFRNPSGSHLLFDTFQENNNGVLLTNHTSNSGHSWFMCPYPGAIFSNGAPAQYQINSSAVISTDQTFQCIESSFIPTTRDYIITGIIKTPSSTLLSGMHFWTVDLVGRLSQDPNNTGAPLGYNLELSYNSGIWTLVLYDTKTGGGGLFVGSGQITITAGTAYTMTLSMKGSTITGTLNGGTLGLKTIQGTEPTPLPAGQVGMVMWPISDSQIQSISVAYL